MANDMLQAADLNGLYAIIPTPAKADAGRVDALNTVDLDETNRLVNALIDAGVSGLIALGTTGECATLSQEDFRSFVACVAETVGKRIPIFIGATGLGSHDVYERMRFVRDCGADGTLLGLPMWQPLTLDGAVSYYRDLSLAVPDLAVMVYANVRAFRFDFPAEFWSRVSREAPSVIAAKFSRPKNLPELIRTAGGRIHFMPNETTVAGFAKIAPDTTTACWATAASMGPEPVLAMMEAVRRRDDAAIARIASSMAWANEPVQSIIEDPARFAQFNIQLEKVRINAAGYCNSGPIRPPYGNLPDDIRQAAEACGGRWATLRTQAGDLAASSFN
jgi:trans-o-hydroxybenzylidenepyruvate hydratase-aldolase